MTPHLTTFRAQIRHLRVIPLIIDGVMMIAVGMLTMFVLLLASFQSFDAVLFESTLRYDSRADLSQPPSDDGLNITVTQGVRVVSARRFDDPSRQPGDFTDSVTPVVWSHAEKSGERLGNLLGASMIAGTAAGSGVVIDEATAAALGVSAGDGIVLTTWDDDRCRLTLSGITRTSREVGGSVLAGLLLVPADACEPGVTTWTEDAPAYLQFDSETPAASSQGWGERMRDVVVSAMDVRVSGLLPVVLVIGLGLWCLMSLRATRRIRATVAMASDLLRDFGCRAARVRRTHLLVSGAVIAIAALGAAWGAHEALWRVARFFTQWAHWVFVAIIFFAATMTVLLIAHARARREASRRPAPPTVTPATTTKGNA